MYDFNDSAKANVYPIDRMLGMCILTFLAKKKKKIHGTGMSLD